MSVVSSWTVLDSQLSFADPWLRVRSDRVRTVGGDVFGPFHVIEYPDWVSIVPLAEGSLRLLLVREYRHGVGRVMAGLPGGLVDPGDGAVPDQAARAAAWRELTEETGYGGGRLDHLATLHPNPSNQSNTAYCFLATGLSREAQPRPGGPGEAQDLVEVDLVDTLAAMRDGLLPLHAIHCAALWSAAVRIGADRSGRFGAMTDRGQRFLTGRPADLACHVPCAEVGGMMQPTLRYRAISRVMVVTLLLVALTVVTHAVWPRLANHASGNVPQPSVHLRMEIQPRGVAQRLGGPDRGLGLVTAPQG